MRNNLFKQTGLHASFLALLVMLIAPFPALSQTPEEPAAVPFDSPILHDLAETELRAIAEREKLHIVHDTFWNDAFAENFSPGESSLLLRETGDPRHWDVMVAHAKKSTEDSLGLAYGHFEEVQRFELPTNGKGGFQCGAAMPQAFEIESYLVVGSMVGSTGIELLTWGIVTTAGDMLQDADGIQLRVFTPAGVASELEEAIYHAEVWSGVTDSKPDFGDLLNPTEKSTCREHCLQQFTIDGQKCSNNRLICLAAASSASTSCAGACAMFACVTGPLACTACLAVCLAVHAAAVIICNNVRDTCMSQASLDKQKCIQKCPPPTQ